MRADCLLKSQSPAALRRGSLVSDRTNGYDHLGSDIGERLEIHNVAPYNG